jgi:hypothetical protein
MSDMKKMTLTYGENYNSYDDSVMFMENFKQHLLEESVLARFPEVVDDLTHDAEHLIPDLMMLADGLNDDDVDDKVNHALCISSLAMRIAAYFSIKEESDEYPGEEQEDREE